MNKKNGITMLVLIVAVVVMIILISSASVIGGNSINTAKFDEYLSNLKRVSDNVNEYYLKNGKLPITNEQIDASSFSDAFANDVSKNGDQKNKLYIIDMSKIQDSSVSNGIGSITDKDVYIVAQNSQNVYYLKGFKYKSVMYFSNY